MCGARRLHKQSRAVWFFIFIFFLLLLTISQGEVLLIQLQKSKVLPFSFPPEALSSFSTGDQELVHVIQDSYSSPMSGGGEEQLSRLGSNPPCCERKCGGCAPCTAVPQCSNYQPVGWKCKCGAAVFDP